MTDSRSWLSHERAQCRRVQYDLVSIAMLTQDRSAKVNVQLLILCVDQAGRPDERSGLQAAVALHHQKSPQAACRAVTAC